MKRLNVNGYIASDDDKWFYEMFDISVVTPGDIRNFLAEADGDDVELHIDCLGGIVRMASDMYSELRGYLGKSTAYVVGVSASASTVLMLGCNKVIASPTSRIMIHNAQSMAEGDYRDMQQAAEMLKKANDSIINAYEIKTGMSRKDLQALMDKETWMTAQEAKKYGFVDEIALKEGETLSDTQIAAVLSMREAVYASASLNPAKMHEFALKFKKIDGGKVPDKAETPEDPPKEAPEGGPGEPEKPSGEQLENFKRLREKYKLS